MSFSVGQIVENHLPSGKVIVCRIVEDLSRAGRREWRIADVRDGGTDRQLIARRKTWVCPEANLRPHDADCGVCHRDGLVVLGV